MKLSVALIVGSWKGQELLRATPDRLNEFI